MKERGGGREYWNADEKTGVRGWGVEGRWSGWADG